MSHIVIVVTGVIVDAKALVKKLNNSGITILSGELSPCVVREYLTTGCVVLDEIMGGGLPVGRMTEVYGDTATGKSLIAAQCCVAAQLAGGLAIYIDTESAVSVPILQAVGVDIDNLVYSSPDTVEDVFAVMEGVLGSKTAEDLVLIIWDSIAATSSDAEMDKDTGEMGYLTQSRVISQGLRKLARLLSKSRCAAMFLNQAKQNIGIVYGDSVATFGGKAVGFHSSVRVHLTLGAKITEKRGKDKRVKGIVSHARVTKNKVAVPFREADLPIYFGHGIYDPEASLRYLKRVGAVKYAGGVYTVKDDSLEGDVQFTPSEWSSVYLDNIEVFIGIIHNVMNSEDLI